MLIIKKMIAEFIGTFVLVVFGCGSAVAANTLIGTAGLTSIPLALSTLLIAFAFGLVIVAMAYSVGNVSGCHINPAVSFGMLLSGRMNMKEFAQYVVAQLFGGIVGAAFLCGIFGSNSALGQNSFGGSMLSQNAMNAMMVEVVLTFVFVFVILCVTSKIKYEANAGLVIGFTLTLVHIFGIPFTGTSVNPARSFGPALLAGGEALSQVWVFIVAPLIGAAIAALVYKAIIEDKKD